MSLTRRAALKGMGAALALPRAGFAQDSGLAALVDQVDPARLRRHVGALSAFPTRWTNHADFGAVEAWVAGAFEEDGSAARLQPFAMPSGKTRHNVAVVDPNDQRDIILVGAHFDSISETPATHAPGANDNATGVAAMLEVHRILAPLSLDKQVAFIGFAGEEQGLLGATHAATQAARDGWPIALMLNLDMLGWRPPRPDAPMIIEYDQGNGTPTNDAAARGFAVRAADLARDHTHLATAHTDIWSSDYMPFEARGFPAIGLFDGGTEGGHYHTTADTADTVDYGRLTQATRLALAIAADAAGFAR